MRGSAEATGRSGASNDGLSSRETRLPTTVTRCHSVYGANLVLRLVTSRSYPPVSALHRCSFNVTYQDVGHKSDGRTSKQAAVLVRHQWKREYRLRPPFSPVILSLTQFL